MTDQTKRFVKLADICQMYSVSRTALWRLRRMKGNDPFPKPLNHKLNASVFFDAAEVDSWFSRQLN
ncbi:helix-turn-helix transcriptional regulator [Pasteurella multocida]|uniref:helix-turn-helix transcriptional regulator n=1 Tax=Pasteurella multocida TaxID=747 RepID=UPI000981A0D7|nr:AlpA family phage regulatory protein [Pasteurella multocida]MBJ6777517.1 AlpA family phage regulatory protein [Pasteurella multocida subsp. multocida]MBM9430813.1 AlpA family phage regulatory protein [Pasteurella multocida]MDV6009598.1 AlpA family phage regulatory protein [Pasteurella multocida subsp. multocida]MRN36210.1 AlpA family phage regulatory protein [Pasteurella multocida]QNM47470.1 AlpA family phage regulatory protein [Pasteurella multocida]